MPTVNPTPTCRALQAAGRGAISPLLHPDTFAPPRFGISRAPVDRNFTSLRTPGRAIVPTPKRRCGPSGCLILVTEIARIRNLQRLGLLRPNETKRVAADFHVAESLGDCRHVTGSASAARAAGRVVRMLLDAGGVRPILRVGAMTGQAHRVSRFAQHRLIFGTVRIMATETRDAARVHEALNEIVALHAVLVSRAVGKCVKLVSPSLCSSSCQKSARFNPTWKPTAQS